MLESGSRGVRCEQALNVPERDRSRAWTREDAVRELVRGRLEAVGPTTAADVARSLGVAVPDVDFPLGALEHEGFRLRGRFTPGVAALERQEPPPPPPTPPHTPDLPPQEFEPVTAADLMAVL